jgi:SAM-dependent methyltransferase
LKLNLGCGNERLAGFVNVDKLGEPELRWDLEQFPWPWPDASVDEVRLHHVLEHLGQSPAAYLKIVQELYRVCRGGAKIVITVPHPRHDDFLCDPTHVRPILPESFQLFSKSKNREWAAKGASNSPLGLHYDVDFEIERVTHTLDPVWLLQLQSGKVKREEIGDLAQQINNVIKESEIELRVVKQSGQEIAFVSMS